MSRRSSLAGIDEMKHIFEQTSLSFQDHSVIKTNSNSNHIDIICNYVEQHTVGISDSDDSDDVICVITHFI